MIKRLNSVYFLDTVFLNFQKLPSHYNVLPNEKSHILGTSFASFITEFFRHFLINEATMKLLSFLVIFSFNFLNANAQDMNEVDALINKYKVTIERPKACPMESLKYADLLAKTEAIKNVFKSNCLEKDSKVADVLSSVKDIQDELKQKNLFDKSVDGSSILSLFTGNNSQTASGTTGTSDATQNALTGAKFSALFTNISTVIKKNQCNLDDVRILQTTADLINESTQLGLISGNPLGLIVAGGGFIVSSALRLIDMIIKQKFDFDKNTDRQTFIKLNCSFYDIRRDLENRGALEIESSLSSDDLRDVKDLIEKIIVSIKNMEQEKVDQKKVLDSMDQQTVAALVGDVSVFKKNLLRIKGYLSSWVVDSNEMPIETQKMMIISNLAQDNEQLITQLNNYRNQKISTVPMLDDLFLSELQKFDSLKNVATFQQILQMPAKDFNDQERGKLLFYVTRILSDIAVKEDLASTQNQAAKKARVQELQKRQEFYITKLQELQKIKDRLDRIVAPKAFSATDDGTDNMVSILENYKNISEQVYGEWGNKFLNYATQKSYTEIQNFAAKVERFNKKYGEQIKSYKLNDAPPAYLCQDVQAIRVSYKYADSLVQEGYDFIVTNKDLFNTDGKNYYNAHLDEENKDFGLGPVERIQRHYKSTILALKKLKGETIDPDDEEKYLSRSFGSNSYLGRSMIDITAAKAQARNVQVVFNRMKCTNVMINDLN